MNNYNQEWVESAKRLAEYVYQDDNNLESYRNWCIDGQNPREHIYYHAALVLGKDSELDIDISEYEDE
jgi:hypothetical protein